MRTTYFSTFPPQGYKRVAELGLADAISCYYYYYYYYYYYCYNNCYYCCRYNYYYSHCLKINKISQICFIFYKKEKEQVIIHIIAT